MGPIDNLSRLDYEMYLNTSLLSFERELGGNDKFGFVPAMNTQQLNEVVPQINEVTPQINKDKRKEISNLCNEALLEQRERRKKASKKFRDKKKIQKIENEKSVKIAQNKNKALSEEANSLKKENLSLIETQKKLIVFLIRNGSFSQYYDCSIEEQEEFILKSKESIQMFLTLLEMLPPQSSS